MARFKVLIKRAKKCQVTDFSPFNALFNGPFFDEEQILACFVMLQLTACFIISIVSMEMAHSITEWVTTTHSVCFLACHHKHNTKQKRAKRCQV